jgi:2'-deoxynucleoside 5'-phosphate N-hydrolase
MEDYTGVDSVLRVYISGALMGASDLNRVRNLYQRFAEACEAVQWEPYLPHTRTDPERDGGATPSEVIDADLRELNRSDVVIAYLGEPSLGVGAEVVLAMQSGKAILAVYESSRRVSRFVGGLLERYPQARVLSFESVDEAASWIGNQLGTLRYQLQGAPHILAENTTLMS